LRSRGYTIIEVMVAITISLIILAALVSAFAGNSRQRHAIERANQQTEDGSYALQLITDDLRNAGYLGTLNPGAFSAPNPQITVPATLPNPCATTLTTLSGALILPVQGYDNGTNAPTCLTDLRANTDILVVRRASTCTVGSAGCDPQVTGDVYLQASGCAAEFGAGTYYVLETHSVSFNLHLKDCVTAAPLYQYRTHIYYVANNDQPNDGIPTLKRAELSVAGGVPAFNVVPLVEGVENLQIEYGLDTNAPTTGSPAVYTADPNTYLACAAATCVSYWGNTVAAKVNILMRDLTPTQGYTDTKTYTLGLTAAGAANTFGPFNDQYRRHVYYAVARLNNPASRNTP
jgi:type IV pilus assembly protein PilW